VSMGDVVCDGEAMRKVLAHAQQVAGTDTAVLLTGETGTGKEVLARAIHRASLRSEKVLVRVNCAALPANLIESELFGHERGAFTGAMKRHEGRFELAHGGTLFLDEIGELPLELQSKLLRVLQEGEFERLGDTQTQKVDVRVIAATNRDLGEAVRRGTFRADLFYRLKVFPIHVPPLRERTDEIPLLAATFLEDAGKRLGRKFDGISSNVIEALQRYAWPGNVRELRNVIERAAVTTRGRRLHLPSSWDAEGMDPETRPAGVPSQPDALPRGLTLPQLESAYIRQVLEQTHWRITGPKGAAIILGMNPSTLRFRMQKLGITKNGVLHGSTAVPDDQPATS
jgi:formate hydrogenlyase transcriptional activator